MFKQEFVISLVIVALIIAIFSQGLISAAFSLLAFALLFYFVSGKQVSKPPYK